MVLGLTTSFFALVFLHMDSLEGYKFRDQRNMKNYRMFFAATDVKPICDFIDKTVLTSRLPGLDGLNIYTYVEDGNYILTGYCGSNIRRDYPVEVGGGFQENSTVENPVLVSNDLLNYDDFLNLENAKFTIMGQEYQVIGAGRFGEERNADDENGDDYLSRQVVIPYDKFKEIAPNCSEVRLHFKQALTSEEMDFLTSNFNKSFPNEKLIVPLPGTKQYAGDIYLTFLIIALGTGLSLVNIVAAFRFWVERNWKKYYTYKLCGASGLQIYSLIAFELLMISMVAFLVALLVYNLLIPQLMGKNYVYYQLNWEKTLQLLGISVLLTLATIHPTARRFSRITPQELKPV
jgi:ABC-type antimicrobial peptide transport system permease subunit